MADWAAAGQAQCYHSLLTSSERLSQNWWPKLFFIFPTFLFIFCYVRQFMNRWQIARYGYWVWVESLRICCHLFSPQSLEDSIRDPCLFHFFIFFIFFFLSFSFFFHLFIYFFALCTLCQRLSVVSGLELLPVPTSPITMTLEFTLRCSLCCCCCCLLITKCFINKIFTEEELMNDHLIIHLKSTCTGLICTNKAACVYYWPYGTNRI